MAAPPCHLVAVPYPGRGHVNAMLNLCRLLAARDGVTITVVVTEEWLGLLGAPAALPDLGPRVRFEAIPNVIPSEHGRANDMVGFLEAVHTKMAAPFERPSWPTCWCRGPWASARGGACLFAECVR